MFFTGMLVADRGRASSSTAIRKVPAAVAACQAGVNMPCDNNERGQPPLSVQSCSHTVLSTLLHLRNVSLAGG